MKIVRRISTGETFVECPLGLWDDKLRAWKRDHTQPWPMPEGHTMFKRPFSYGFEMVNKLRRF
jgi:hypothetical protein